MTKLLIILIWMIAFTILAVPFLQRANQIDRQAASDAKCDTDSDCGCEEDCLDGGPPWRAVDFQETQVDYKRFE